jgi:integration host factor subunit beta
LFACGRMLFSLCLKNQTQADTDIFSALIKIHTGDKFLNKLELIHKLQKKCNLTKQEASKTVEMFFSEMTKALSKGDRVEIRGFCSFFIKEYDGYTGRNPKTGKKAQVAPKKLPFFKCGKGLKERVDYPAN